MVDGDNARTTATRPGKADLHLHTSVSDGMADVPELLDHIEEHTDLDVVAITDHDHIRGAWKAREVWANRNHRFDIVPGIEVTTIQGHLLALFVEDPIDSLIPMEQAIREVHRQGGLCVIPHPMSWATRSLNRSSIIRVSNGDRELRVDGIETATGSSAGRIWTRKARMLNRALLNLPEIGGSDSHFSASVGCAYTEFPGRTAEELRSSILNRTTRAASRRYPSVFEIGIGQLMRQTWRGLSTTPRTMGLGRTAWSFCQSIFNIR